MSANDHGCVKTQKSKRVGAPDLEGLGAVIDARLRRYASGNARLLRDEEMLAALGYEPVGFSSADAALAACRAAPERFDTVVVGCLGSVAASLELATALHAAVPRLRIVLASKSIEEIGADTLVAAGVTDVVHWPIIAPQIAAALHCPTKRLDPEPQPSASHTAY